MNHLLNSYKISQDNYDLFYDGSIVVNNFDTIVEFLQLGVNSNKIFVEKITPNIIKFNRFTTEKIRVKENLETFDITWNLPEKYINLNIESLLEICLEQDIKNCSESEQLIRSKRYIQEINIFKSKELFPVLHVIHYVIDTFKLNNVVWGIGRGSCVSSYILYLLEVHDVDPITYELNIADFLD